MTLLAPFVYPFETPNGSLVRLSCRGGLIDANLSFGILTEDEYRLRGRRFSGTMLDVGGYIGAVGIALAVENPDLRVVIVEPLAENCAVIAENIMLNGLEDRVSLLAGAAGSDGPTEIIYDYRHVESEPDEYVQASRYVGNIYAADSHPMAAQTCTVEGYGLATLLDRIDVERLSLLKLDCEGCEWMLLRDRAAVDRVDTIIGEWHGDPRLPGLIELLPDHEVVQVDDNPVNGIFRATHR